MLYQDSLPVDNHPSKY